MSTSFIQERFSDQISNARGIGLFCSVDVKSTEHRDKLMGDMKGKGEFIYRIGPSQVVANQMKAKGEFTFF